ncbi:hypothetical protein [Pararhizobium haloflavum]|uniref:hypothetical protein n=1 Tax=Pararhizobium haloflavum TaxID=2037914 RepID=UPI000C177EA6|nr:hypothetical protein [Pararhizobium haloflavum]
MANKVNPVARSKVSIGAATTTWDEATAAADLTYELIGRIRNIGNFGDTFQDISVDEVNDGRTRHGKGTANAGTMDLVCSLDDSDAGQVAAKAAADSYDAFNFKIELAKPDGTFKTVYISALVMSKTFGLGGPNDTQTITFSLTLNEAPIEVDPA